jgi:hypothetical protein
MTLTRRTGTGSAPARPAMARAFVIAVHVTAALVLLQAVLGGRIIAGDDVRTVHQMIGNLVFLAAVAQLVLVFLAGVPGRLRTALIVANVLMLVLVVAQIGMGYSARDDANVRGWHVTNGALVFALATANVSLALRART